MAVALVNERTQKQVAASVELAVTRTTRRRGLLGRDALEASAAMLLAPCGAVHTAFMRFPIDVVFIDRDGRAVKIVGDVRPWRIALAVGAYAVIEMAAGTLQKHQVSVGDRLYLAPDGDPAATPATTEFGAARPFCK